MKRTPTTKRIDDPDVIVLNSGEVEDLADTMSFVDAWLRTASDETLEDLAEHIDADVHPGAVRDVADAFIIQIGMHVITLRRRIKQVSR